MWLGKFSLAAAVIFAASRASVAQQEKTPAAAAAAPASAAAVPAKVGKPVSFSIVVQDKHHHPQTNVTKEELQLLEDSKPQVIQSLVADTERPLLLGLLIDTSKRQEDVLEAERKMDKAFLEKELARPKDQAFVIHFDKEIELMQDLTGDKKLLDSAIDDLRTAVDDDDAWSSHSGDDEDSARRKRRGATRLFDAVYLASDEILRKPDGHKVLIVISDGVDHGSKESMSGAVESAQRTGTVVYAVYVPGEQEKQQQPQQQNGGHRNGGGGSGGGGWPGSGGGGWPGSGGQTGGGNGGGGNGGGGNGGQKRQPQQVHEDGRKVLEALTAKTGGRMIETKKKDEITGALETIAEDVRSSYLVTYTPDPDMGTGFHRIGMTVPRHGDWTVQSTEGLYTAH